MVESAKPLLAGEAAADSFPETAQQIADASTIKRRRSSDARMSIAVNLLAVIAVVAALYLARAFVVPLLIGIIASYALRSPVDWLQSLRLPRTIAAAIVVALLVGTVSWVAYSLSDQAAVMIEKLPTAAHKLRQNMGSARSKVPSPLQNVQETANELQRAAADVGQKPGVRAAETPAPDFTSWLRGYVMVQSALLLSVLAQTPIVLLLTYFLLASGDHFRRKLVQFVGPTLSRKKDALHMLDEIDAQIQRYLLVMLASNTLVAICSWLAFAAMGIEQAGIWGVSAGVMHFIPYLGPALLALAVGVAGYLQFGTLLQALAAAGVALLIAGAIGHVFMTWLQSRFARVNAAVLFIALLFFGWLWGAAGLLLGAPLVAIAKVICDRVESLQPIGDLMGK